MNIGLYMQQERTSMENQFLCCEKWLIVIPNILLWADFIFRAQICLWCAIRMKKCVRSLMLLIKDNVIFHLYTTLHFSTHLLLLTSFYFTPHNDLHAWQSGVSSLSSLCGRGDWRWDVYLACLWSQGKCLCRLLTPEPVITVTS